MAASGKAALRRTWVSCQSMSLSMIDDVGVCRSREMSCMNFEVCHGG